METWKSIKGYEGYYEVSDMGNVRGLDRLVRTKKGGNRFIGGQPLKQSIHRGGYTIVGLTRSSKNKTFFVHRLVTTAFIGECPEGKEVNHIDENKKNNALGNLEYVTRKENMNHGTARERMVKKRVKPIVAENIETGELTYFPSLKSVSELSNRRFHRSGVSPACNGGRDNYKGHYWSYVFELEREN